MVPYYMQFRFKATTFETAAATKYYIQAAPKFLEDGEKRPSFVKVTVL